MTWRCCMQVHDELVLRNTHHKAPFVVADYSALEVVILADLCLRLFNDPQIAGMVAPGAPDVHGVNAREVFGRHLQWVVPDGLPDAGRPVLEFEVKQFKGKDAHPFAARLRDMVKTTFYGLAYRKGAYGLSVLEGGDGKMIGEKRAQEMLDAFRVAMPGIFKWHDWVSEYVREHGGIYSLGGRWCPLAEESAPGVPEWLRARGDRRATNFPLQATGAEIVGDAMVRVRSCPELADYGTTAERAGQLLQGHMVTATANGTRLLIPLTATVGIGENYWESK